MFENWARKKTKEIKGWISSSSLILVYIIHLPIVHLYTNFQTSKPHSSREKCDEKFQCWKLGEKKKWIKGRISSSSLIPVNLIHLPTVHMCTKFQSSRPHSSREKCDKKFQCWKLERKKNEEIKGQIRAAAWLQYTWYICPLPMCVPSFNLLGLTVPEKSVTKNSNIWKVNWTWRLSIENLIHSFELVWDFMPVLVIRKFDEDPIKNERASLETPFSHFKSGKLFRRSRAANSIVRGPIWLKFQLIRDFIRVLVTCKYKKNRIENNREKVETSFFPL